MNHRLRKTFIAAAALSAAWMASASMAQTSTPALPAHFAAPYLQIQASNAGDMANDMNASGNTFYSLAFLIPASGCTPKWEDNGEAVDAFTSQVSALQAAGGNVIISFGGEAGGELAQTCTSVSDLEAAYANVVTTYNVNRLDFDIEGSILDDTASNSIRNQALAQLQAAYPGLQISFTLPVDPTGLESNATALLQDALNAGVQVSAVNIMTMDFGNGQNPLSDAESAANATVSQLESLYGISSKQAWNMLGLTPIAGQNDDDENFTQSDAAALESFAATNGVQELAFWEVDGYDKPLNYAYTKIFTQITSGGSGGGGSSGSTTFVNQNTSYCMSVSGGSTSPGALADVYTCNGSASETWTINSDGIITNNNSGLCLDVQGQGTTDRTPVDTYNCNGQQNQQWAVNSDGTIVGVQSGLCLSVSGGSTSLKARLDIYTCNGSASEHWNPLSG